MLRDVSREGWARRNRRCALSAALVSKAAFIMREHSQNRKQTAAQTKPKKTPGKESVSLKWIFRVGWERCVLKPAAMSNIQGCSIRQCQLLSESPPHTLGPIPVSPPPAHLLCSPWRADPSTWHTLRMREVEGWACTPVTFDAWESETTRLLADLR